MGDSRDTGVSNRESSRTLSVTMVEGSKVLLESPGPRFNAGRHRVISTVYDYNPVDGSEDSEETLMKPIKRSLFITKTRKLVRLILRTFKSHAIALCFVALSFASCVYAQLTNVELVDTSFFKGVGILLAMLLSLRARTCVSRREVLIQRVLSMISSAQSLIYLGAGHDDIKREKLHVMFGFAFAQVAHWFNDQNGVDANVCPNYWQGPSIEELPEEFRERAMYESSFSELYVPPRNLLLFLQEVLDEVWEPWADDKYDKVSVIRRWHKLVDIELNNIITQYDFLCVQLEELLPSQFVLLVQSLILCYVSLYPWCVANESIMVLGSTTMGMALTFYCLNALSEEIENPLQPHDHGFDLTTSFKDAFYQLKKAEQLRRRCRDRRVDQSRAEFIADELASRHMRASLKDQSPVVRMDAASTLGDLGRSGAQHVGLLHEVSRLDIDPSVRGAAHEAVQKLQPYTYGVA